MPQQREVPSLLIWVASFVMHVHKFLVAFRKPFPVPGWIEPKNGKKVFTRDMPRHPIWHVQDGVVLSGFEANEHWYWRTSCRKCELLSLIVHLSPAAAVVWHLEEHSCAIS